ncbi:MAG: hypothetical protein R3274_00140, partial [Desulfobacterales bacterium]|nr:hypothetical protein [Desulfobacterales bacterium]
MKISGFKRCRKSGLIHALQISIIAAAFMLISETSTANEKAVEGVPHSKPNNIRITADKLITKIE